MLELVCQRAQVADGLNIMDLGCGWGVTGLYIAEKYPNCTVTCVSNSSTQAKHINGQAAKRGSVYFSVYSIIDSFNLSTDCICLSMTMTM